MSYFTPDPTVSLEQRRHRLGQIKLMTKSWRDTDFSKLDRGTFDILEARVLDEARAAARNSGRLFASSYRDDTGRKITEYEGDDRACWAPFMRPGATIKLNMRPGERTETVTLQQHQKIVVVDK